MTLLKKMLLAALLAAGPVSCSTPDYDPDLSPPRPYVPRVTMPVDLNREEQNLIGDVENMLEQNGLRPSDRSGVDYQLAFSVEDGPVNADVTLDLYQGRDRIAHAFARTGGPRIIFQRQRVIRESFDKALRQFEAQLPRTSGYRVQEGGAREPHPNSRPDFDPYGSSNRKRQEYPD